MHTDEAVNAYIVGQELAGEAFTYDPRDRHGPALTALAVPLARMRGAKSFSELTESELRLTSVVAGSLTILLFGAAVEMFGFMPSLLAALLFALSPLPVYYDRYFIHESLFCAATFALILSAWRASQTGSVMHATLAGASASLMVACKETAILHLFALAVASIVYWWRNEPGETRGISFRPKQLLAAAGAFLAFVAMLFTWFGRNARAAEALLRAIPAMLPRAGGQGHEKPFWYYGQLLVSGWSGGLLVALALFGFVLTIRKRDASPHLLLAYYGVLLTAIYSLIPYKTPWLALNLWLPLAILAARAIEFLWLWSAAGSRRRARVPAFSILALMTCALIARDTRARVFAHPADDTNPYAYAHTSDDILGLPTEIADLAQRQGIAEPRIAVIASDPWPLPWYLRHFRQVGFWQPGQQLGEMDFYITSIDAAEQYADRLRGLRPEFFGVRPGVLILLWSPAPK